jgi:thiosulfate/3-mercaptopyruvate sulfurtransferase
MRRLALTMFTAAVLSAFPAAAQTARGAVPLLVSTAWLEEHLQDPQVVVLWTDQGAHDEALVAGARAVRHESVMTMQGGHGLAAPEVLVDVLRKAGVSNDSHVVIYGDALSSGWLFFVLDYLGHPRVSLLDGGLVKWRSEDRPIARTPVVPPPGTFTPQTCRRARRRPAPWCSTRVPRMSTRPDASLVRSF